METIYEIFELAAFLWAQDRLDEALAVADSVAAAVPAPPPLPRGGFNYNVWCPATFSHALMVHQASARWLTRAKASRAAVLADSGVARDNPTYIASKVNGADTSAEKPVDEDTIKWKCQRLARDLGTMVLYSVLAKAGDSAFKRHQKKVDELIPRLRSKLRDRLNAGK